jgi:hypothetical protein
VKASSTEFALRNFNINKDAAATVTWHSRFERCLYDAEGVLKTRTNAHENQFGTPTRSAVREWDRRSRGGIEGEF